MSARHFMQDCMQIAAGKVRDGQLSRRTFLKAGAAIGVSPLFLSASDALADKPTQLVHANWGGDAIKCTTDSYGNSFTQANGIKVIIDGSGPLEGSIAKQVDGGKVIWDCCDADFFNALRLGPKGKLEKIDYSIVDKSNYFAPFTDDYGVLGYWYSYILAWDTEKLGKTAPTWADFFDVKKIPGKRTMYKWMTGAPEAALLADGVAPDKIYPLDLDRALKKIESIKDHIIFWDSGAASQQMFIDKEVVMGSIWQTRADLIKKDTGGRVDWTFDQGTAAPAAWIIPKGNPAGNEWANRWVASLSDPARQIAAMKCYGQGPANPKAYDSISAEDRAATPGAPENLKRMVLLDSKYFQTSYDDVLNGYLDMISR
jgi:putative spermidine/putrescine transport system substrate-binding protein